MRAEAEAAPSSVDFRPTEHVEFVLLVIPDVNGSLRGKALRPDAFEAAVRHSTVMTDLLLALDPVAAFEDEVRLRDGEDRLVTSGISYSAGEVAAIDPFVSALRPALEDLGAELTAVHTEAAPGLIELNLAARPALEAADNAAYTKFAVKELARSMGMRASFLAKTAPGEEGSSGHVHLSAWRDGSNAFAGSTVLSAAIAGVLEHLAAASLLLNPTIN